METSFNTTIMMLCVIVLIPIVGGFMALTPYLMRKGEVFAVTVPEAYANDPYLKSLKRRFALIVGSTTLGFTLFSLLMLAFNNEAGVLVCIIVGTLLICFGSYALMLFFRSKVTTYKAAQHWEAKHQEAAALVDEKGIPQPISLKWNLLYIPIFVITAVVGYMGYTMMPEQIVMHVGLDGQATDWVEKSPFIILMPVLIQMFFAFCFVISHWMILRSKRISNPATPVASALAYGMFAHAQSLYLVVGGLLITACMIAMPFTFIGVLTMMQAAIFIMIAALVLVVGALAIAVIYGQGGARVFNRMQASDTLLSDDDKYWKLGVFYFNPNDPNWFLPARFGIGWTCNYGRPAVWVFLLGFLALIIGFIVAIMALA